jgi:uncharacterized damage-inducible protein DinB
LDRYNHICLRATYNEWMNAKIYNAIMYEVANDVLTSQNNLIEDIIKKLNHLIVVDTLWLQRFAIHPANYTTLASVLSIPAPHDLEQIISSDIHQLSEFRQYLDKMIGEWAHTIARIDLDHQLCYKNTHGIITNHKFFNLIMYFFNYQAFIREKLIILLEQADIVVGETELIVPMPSGIDI